jgi:hypothetical protein
VEPTRSRLDRDRWDLYRRELGPTAALVASLLVLAVVSRMRPRALVPSLMVVAVADLLTLGWIDRPVRTAPIRPLTEQSRVLEALGRLGPDARTLGGLGNLPMAAGVGALPAYRTLDRPVLEGLVALAGEMPRSVAVGAEDPGRDALIRTSLRDAGIDARVFGPLDLIGTTPGRVERLNAWGGGTAREILDPVLAAWDHGPRFAETAAGKVPRYAIWRPGEPTARAWFIPATSPDAARMQALAPSSQRDWRTLGSRSPSPEVIEVVVNIEAPGWVILSVLDDPEWRGEWIDESGARPAPLNRVFQGTGAAGWIGVAWIVWGLAYWRAGRGRPRPTTDNGDVKGDAA